MLKVMQFIHGLNTGGAETLVKDYALNIDREDFETVVLCIEHHTESPYEALLQQAGIKVIYICDEMPLYNNHCILAKILNLIQRYCLIRKYIRKEKPDILHTHLNINNYVKFSRPPHSLNILHTVHSEPQKLWFSGDSIDKQLLKKKRRDYNAAKWLVSHYNMRFIVLHDEMRMEVNELFNVDDTIIVNNGIDFNRFENIKSRDSMRQELGISLHAFVIGHVGRFSFSKNHTLLVEIFHEIYAQNKCAFLLMVGSGPLKTIIKEKLDAYGLKGCYKILSNRTDIPDILNCMDVFVFPSLYEGLGISVIEAQKAKLPCIISDHVPQAVFVSNLIKVVSLSECAAEWANSICNFSVQEPIYTRLDEWDMKNVIQRLQDIYSKRI